MNDVAVILPVLGRPGYVLPLLESLFGSQGDALLRAVFLVSEGDDAEVAAIEEASDRHGINGVHGMDTVSILHSGRPPGRGDYALKINQGYAETVEPWLFLGADDLCFCPRWADEAIAASRPGQRVVGTNDLGNRRVVAGVHSTHTLVARSYIAERGGTADGSGAVLHPGYHHNFVDDEFIATAVARGEFVHARGSWVEHLHPLWDKGNWDDTYARGQAGFEDDRRLFESRRRLWRPSRRA